MVLPLQAGPFLHAAEAVKAGIHAARDIDVAQARLEVIATGAADDSVVAGYREAAARGARVIIGPMHRTGVSALVKSELATLPTIVLAAPDPGQNLPRWIYAFSLSIEAEARQLAQIAAREYFRAPLVVTTGAPLERRGQQAFSDAWRKLGGKQVEVIEFAPLPVATPAIRARLGSTKADFIVLFCDAERLRTIRPYLKQAIPTYATSHTYTGCCDARQGVDLEGVHFLDLPWLLIPDHPAVMVYPRPDGYTAELERFYALGVDAFRLALEILADNGRNFQIDGVTGQLNMGRGNSVERTLVHAVLRGGRAAVLP